MSKQTVKVIRALPGAGKSFLAAKLGQDKNIKVVSADHFFETPDGEYNFNPALLGQAHAECLSDFVDFVHRGYDVIVDNTNSQLWEFENYIDIAMAINSSVKVEIHEILTPGIEAVRIFTKRNTHKVPASVTLNMWLRWETCPALHAGRVEIVRHDPFLG